VGVCALVGVVLYVLGFLDWGGSPDSVVFSGGAAERGLTGQDVGRVAAQYTKQYGDHALMHAAAHGYHQVVRSLLKSPGGEWAGLVDLQDGDGYTPLMRAAYQGFETVCEELMGGGADPNLKATHGGRTPLILAAEAGHRRVAHVLLLHGADADAKDNDGSTALMFAAREGSVGLVRELLAAKADTGVVNRYGSTALDVARMSQKPAVVAILGETGTAQRPSTDSRKEESNFDFDRDRERRRADQLQGELTQAQAESRSQQERIDALTKDLRGLREDNARLEGQVAKYRQDDGHLQSEMDACRARTKTLQGELQSRSTEVSRAKTEATDAAERADRAERRARELSSQVGVLQGELDVAKARVPESTAAPRAGLQLSLRSESVDVTGASDPDREGPGQDHLET